MEEASALANEAGILATRMLGRLKFLENSRKHSLSTISSSRDGRIARRSVPFKRSPLRMSNSRRSDQRLTSHTCDSWRKGGGRRGDEVPPRGEVAEYTVERSTLETASLKAIRENQVADDAEGGRKRKISGLLRWFSSR